MSRKSVMPEGFESSINKTQMTDLLEFLTNTGGFLPLPFDKYANTISTKGIFSDGDNGPDRLRFREWGQKEFEGIPFVVADPKGKSKPNIIVLHGPRNNVAASRARSVKISCQHGRQEDPLAERSRRMESPIRSAENRFLNRAVALQRWFNRRSRTFEMESTLLTTFVESTCRKVSSRLIWPANNEILGRRAKTARHHPED